MRVWTGCMQQSGVLNEQDYQQPGSIKRGEFEHLSDYKLVQDSAPWNCAYYR
jgi:hypothetical protein